MVADDRNNLSMFPLCKLRIGYNPDFVLTAKSDFVTRGALTEILPPITGENHTAFPSAISKSRGLREAIHTGSFLLIFICIYLTGNILVASLILLLAVLYTHIRVCQSTRNQHSHTLIDNLECSKQNLNSTNSQQLPSTLL